MYVFLNLEEKKKKKNKFGEKSTSRRKEIEITNDLWICTIFVKF